MSSTHLLLGTITILMLGMLWFDRRVWSRLDASPDVGNVTRAGLDHAGWLLLPIGAALVANKIAAELGHKRFGIELALGMLLANSIVVTIVRIRAFGAASRPVRSGLVRAQLASSACAATLWIAVATYLLGWV